ncbi:hypothetical protein DDE18_09940 [Nocardioides gansuensis]|uniref:SHOCT domain-containing protein n=1 Tax=Nocardioides gansuensis TaxID=2138300 RepID=A0A2T8FAE6_9ACTN|nr:SHOCT domain-containing protein [Nocardioides gansuensis]PVG82679.1 hypothetical protein DDE18_09940 [Nocardioides gansuensis]
MDSGGGFGLLFGLVVLAGVVGTLWKIGTARDMARSAGLDEDRAATMAVLTDDGLEELASLLARGVISQEEHDRARADVLRSI